MLMCNWKWLTRGCGVGWMYRLQSDKTEWHALCSVYVECSASVQFSRNINYDFRVVSLINEIKSDISGDFQLCFARVIWFRIDRTDRQRTDSIERTVSQTVAQKRTYCTDWNQFTMALSSCIWTACLSASPRRRHWRRLKTDRFIQSVVWRMST